MPLLFSINCCRRSSSGFKSRGKNPGSQLIRSFYHERDKAFMIAHQVSAHWTFLTRVPHCFCTYMDLETSCYKFAYSLQVNQFEKLGHDLDGRPSSCTYEFCRPWLTMNVVVDVTMMKTGPSAKSGLLYWCLSVSMELLMRFETNQNLNNDLKAELCNVVLSPYEMMPLQLAVIWPINMFHIRIRLYCFTDLWRTVEYAFITTRVAK